MEILLNDKDMPLYKKLFVSAQDISYARACATHILKKGWHHQPWEKRGSIYFQQSVYMTALVVAYARCFNRSDGMSKLPSELVTYSLEERGLHGRVLYLRRKLYAHSDGESYSIRPWHLGEGVFTAIVGQPALKLSAEEIEQFLRMTESLLNAIERRKQEMLSRASTVRKPL